MLVIKLPWSRSEPTSAVLLVLRCLERLAFPLIADRVFTITRRSPDSVPESNLFMSPNDNDIEILALELLSAYTAGEMVATPPSARPGFDLNTAYAVESTLERFRESEGTEPSDARSVMPIKLCGARSSWKP